MNLDDLTPDDSGQVGARLLDDVETFLGRFIAYPSEAARIAHVLWIAHTHLMAAWESTPPTGSWRACRAVPATSPRA